jgi:Carboxypeptidase regulatory-like domain
MDCVVSVNTGDRFVPRKALLFLAGVVAAVNIVGCGGGDDKEKLKRPKVAPAQGVVTYKGAPVEGATVVFSPTAGSTAASAVTDSSGRFSMSAFQSDSGAVPGKYKVSITKKEQPPQSAQPAGGHDEPTPETAVKSLIPEKYANAEASQLTADIPEGGKTDLTFELTD